MSEQMKREHIYHAEASVLSGQLQLPVEQEIQAQAFAKVSPKGGYHAQQAEDYRLESIISFKSAHTQVSGHAEEKHGGGYRTLVTSVVEGLNVLNVITADRVVGQISTLHPLVGHVPVVTFLGTGFENLRIAGHRITGLDSDRLDMDLDLFANHIHDRGHLQNPSFLEKVSRQHSRLHEDPDLTPEESSLYSPRRYGVDATADNPNSSHGEAIECSLVNHVRGNFPGKSFGHVIRIPHFGVVRLAHLTVEQCNFVNGAPRETVFDLTMVDIRMGCIASGTAKVASTRTNGLTKP